MQVDVNRLISKFSQIIANLEVENVLKDIQIEELQKKLSELQNKQVEKVEG